VDQELEPVVPAQDLAKARDLVDQELEPVAVVQGMERLFQDQSLAKPQDMEVEATEVGV
jgi:hypothetical protein